MGIREPSESREQGAGLPDGDRRGTWPSRNATPERTPRRNRNRRCPGKACGHFSPAAKPGARARCRSLKALASRDTGGWRMGGRGAKAA